METIQAWAVFYPNGAISLGCIGDVDEDRTWHDAVYHFNKSRDEMKAEGYTCRPVTITATT